MSAYFCTPFTKWFGLAWFISGSGSNQKDGLPDSIMVVRQILVLFVLVRIQVGQQVTRNASCGFCFSGSGASLLAKADGKAKPPDAIGLGHLGNANAGWISSGREAPR